MAVTPIVNSALHRGRPGEPVYLRNEDYPVEKIGPEGPKTYLEIYLPTMVKTKPDRAGYFVLRNQVGHVPVAESNIVLHLTPYQMGQLVWQFFSWVCSENPVAGAMLSLLMRWRMKRHYTAEAQGSEYLRYDKPYRNYD